MKSKINSGNDTLRVPKKNSEIEVADQSLLNANIVAPVNVAITKGSIVPEFIKDEATFNGNPAAG